MATAKQLLKEASTLNFDGFSTKVQGFLKVVVEDQIGYEETKLYSDFIQTCLHSLVTKVKGIQDVGQIEEILKSSITCGRAYKHLLPSLEKDKKHVVPSLLYHTVHGIQDSIHTFADYVVTISELAYEMLDDAGFPESAYAITSAFHSLLWHSSGKLLKQGASQTLRHVLMFRKISLLFICCLPLKNNSIVSMFQYIVTHFSQFNKDWLDKGTSDTFYSIFQAVVDKLNSTKGKDETVEERSACTLLAVRIQTLLVEYLLKSADFVKARQIISGMSEACEKCLLLRSVVDNYLYAVINLEALKCSQKPHICSSKLKNTNSNLKQDILSGRKEELKLLFGALLIFIQSFSSKVLDNLDTALVKELVESCRILQTLCNKVRADCNSRCKKETDKKKQKALSEESVEYVTVCLQTHYRQLQFMHKLLETNSTEESCKECVNEVEEFQQVLEDNISMLPKKTENAQRYNLGYICSVIGSVCIQAGNYEIAALLYKVAVNQLHKCQQPNLMRLFEKLVDCYVHLEKWKEATQTVYQALVTVEDGLKHVAVMWTRLKKDASVKEEIFQSMTLNAVVKSSGKEVKCFSGRQLLLAEYQAWKQCSRRQYTVEYHILRELLDVPQKPVHKAEVMVALAATMCITGYNPEHMSAGEMLNRAIILLDKNLVGSESSLAVACYTKYVLLHEEALEYMRTENGDVDYFGKGDISENSRFTLQQEQENLSFLVRAIELWEKSLGTNEKTSQRSKASKSEQNASKKTPVSEDGDTLFGLEHHVDNLILCGTRLIAMKQPQLALRALQVAKDQLLHVKDSKRASDLSIQLSRALMLLGRFQEAETVVNCKGDNRKQSNPLNLSLLISELYMLTGKRETGLEILQSVLDSNELLGKTQKVYLIQGTAKRLLSIALCLPGSGHMIKSANQYLLSLAFEAVQCHLTVINYLTKSKSLDQNADKWLILNEVLSSMLHLCQLCKFIGLPREALCYLKAGLNISQGQGLPRWSCEFLMEMLGVQSMEAECEKALATAESLDCILSTENQSKHVNLNQSRKGSKSEEHTCNKQSPVSCSNENDNFGFQDSAVTMKIGSDTTEKTPERIYIKQELDSEKKNKMTKMKAPNCSCMVAKSDQCADLVRHRLCMKAGIVLSDFLAQTDMRNSADKLLSEVQSKFDFLTRFFNDSKNEVIKNDFVAGEASLVKNGHMPDPQVVYSYLEACCIKAESYLHQKDFQKVHQMWKSFQNLEQSGSLKNVVHSNILLTRLALCDAAGYMLSLYGDRTETFTKLNQSETGSVPNQSDTDNEMGEATQKFERLSLNPRRKVSFESETETLVVAGTSMKKVKKLSRVAVDMETSVTVNTPKVQFSARKSKNPLTTPSTSRMDVLEKLMASDEEDDEMIVFPKPKPVTPRVVPKSAKTSRIKARSKTEPRNPAGKKPAFVIAEDPQDDSKVACKLDFLVQPNEDVENADVEDLENKPRKQVKRRNCSLTSSLNDSEDHVAENVTSKSVKGKCKTQKLTRKRSVLDKTKRVGTDDENNSDLCASSNFEKESKIYKVLKGKDTDDNCRKSENNGHVKGDIFDFEMEASPVVEKATKSGKGRGKAKTSQRGRKANVSEKVIDNAENDDVHVANKENKSLAKPKRNAKRGQAKKETDNTELVRRNSDSCDELRLEIPIEELSLNNDNDSDTYEQEESQQNAEKLELLEPVIIKDWLKTSQFIQTEVDSNLEPIEIMRGKTATKSKTSKKSGKSLKKAADESIAEQAVEGNSSGEDGPNTSRSVEQMRSGRLPSLNDLDILDHVDRPSVSCVEMPLSGGRSPCESDIIPTLQSLYERLCQFPPNPQHSDVCHILAMHFIDTDPKRAAFLLSDAMAVTFRHQVMLNIAKKARKEAKDTSSTASVKTTSTPPSIMFSRDDLQLSDMIKSIPEDWCVVQLSVVSVGLPWKQIILTRFVKDKDPVVLKLPGFSSPQGCHILKDFSLILERNAESAGITSNAEWWSARRKLDTDMEDLVDRMEKYWTGCWRCALLPGEFPRKILHLACKDISKIVQRDVSMADTELLLLASKIVTEKEIVQCVRDILGPAVQDAHTDSIVSVLKKYSSMGTGKNDKQHTVLILDKAVQHLPWESIPILSDKSVSRMPCLSHLVMQLTHHQAQKNSVFVKGVNPRKTFYILNPDSDLPRTQEFFKDWFESEKDWSGVIGSRPSSEQFIDALTNKDFFIYCGHGSGGRIFTSDDVEKLTARAVTMLMGCSSGRLLVKGQFEPSGMMISYFLAGCPSMVANLWDVTDKDIDKFTEEVIKGWMSSSDGTYLPKLIQKSRAICKLKYLNGLAPVVYGLPVFINKGKK